MVETSLSGVASLTSSSGWNPANFKKKSSLKAPSYASPIRNDRRSSSLDEINIKELSLKEIADNLAASHVILKNNAPPIKHLNSSINSGISKSINSTNINTKRASNKKSIK